MKCTETERGASRNFESSLEMEARGTSALLEQMTTNIPNVEQISSHHIGP
jgi:hypothetical protein